MIDHSHSCDGKPVYKQKNGNVYAWYYAPSERWGIGPAEYDGSDNICGNMRWEVSGSSLGFAAESPWEANAPWQEYHNEKWKPSEMIVEKLTSCY